MSVEFINVTVSTFDLYRTSVQDYGTVAIVGVGGTQSTDPIRIGSWKEAADRFSTNALAVGCQLALRNGAASVWAVDCGTATVANVGTALDKLLTYDVQVVALAGIVETDDNTYISGKLVEHINAASVGRIGVFQLAAGEDASTMPSAIGAALTASESRLFGIAHNSTNDVACACAGLLAGIKPWESPLLKPLVGVSQTVSFSSTAQTGLENAQINTLVNPTFLTGNSFVLGSDFTLGGTEQGIQFIDIRRVIDDITYKIKAGLTDPAIIGTAQISQTGLAVVLGRLTGIMQGCVQLGEIESYSFDFPIMRALAKAAQSRSLAEIELIRTSRTSRSITGACQIGYAGVLHQINIDVKMTV